jgi:hypothetical protein
MVIKGIHYYKNGTIRVLGIAPKGYSPGDLEHRGEIRKLSKKSLQRMALVVNETTIEFKSMITLTYPKDYQSQGRRVKNNLNDYLKYLKYLYPFCGYFWVLEFQARGAPHFHVLVNRVIDNRYRALLALRWAEIVGKDEDMVFYRHNQKGHCDEIQKKDGAKRYVMMYALKPQQKKVPGGYYNVGRFWGCNTIVLRSIPKPDYIKMSEAQLREFLVGSGQYACDFEKWPIVLFCRQNVSRETI